MATKHKPNPERKKELLELQRRDKQAYDLWASARPVGGTGVCGGELSHGQAKKLLMIQCDRKLRKIHDIKQVRENMLNPPPPKPAPLTKEQIREQRVVVFKPPIRKLKVRLKTKPAAPVPAAPVPLTKEQVREQRIAMLKH